MIPTIKQIQHYHKVPIANGIKDRYSQSLKKSNVEQYIVFAITDFSKITISEEKKHISKSIYDRFSYLNKSLDEDQDVITYKKSKNLLLKVISCLNIEEPPLIGVDNAGQVIAEWREYKNNKFVRIICVSKDNIIFQAIRKNKSIININSRLDSITQDIDREF